MAVGERAPSRFAHPDRRSRGWCGRGVAFVCNVVASAVAFGASPGVAAAGEPEQGPARPALGAARLREARGAGARVEGGAGAFEARGAERGRETLWRQPLGFAGLGVGAALLGAGVYSTVRFARADGQLSEPPALAYRTSLLAQDPCSAARHGVSSPQPGAASPEQVRGLCSQVSTFGTLQYAFYGAGALVSGLSALFLLAAGASREAPPPASTAAVAKRGPSKPSWRLHPVVGRTSATLNLHVRF